MKSKKIESRNPSLLPLTVLLIALSSFVYKEQIQAFYYTQFEEHSVSDVVSNLRDYETLPVILNAGIALEGGSFYALKCFALKDANSEQKVYVIPKGKTLPSLNQIQTFKVKVQRQFRVPIMDWDVIVLEEI